MKCPHCNQYHPDNIKFCPQTGKQLPQHLSCTNPECSNFGRNNLPIDSRFCPDCGQKLSNPTENTSQKKDNVSQNKSITSSEAITEYVDMGGSVLWATCNLGAKSPEAIGDYYCWGEINTKGEYTEDGYLYKTVKTTFFGLSKEFLYQSIGSNIAGTSYDTATHVLGKQYMLPSREHFKELEKSCSWILGELIGFKGWWVKNPHNGNKIFFPATGYKYKNDIRDYGVCGYYPSADMSTNGLGWHWELKFDFKEDAINSFGSNGFLSVGDACGLWFWGCNIRPVKKKKQLNFTSK